MICPSRPLELRQSIEDMEQEFALRRGGVHLLGQRNVPPRVFRYRRAPLPPSRRRRSRRNSVASAQPRSRSVRLCYKNGPFVSSGQVGFDRHAFLPARARGGKSGAL